MIGRARVIRRTRVIGRAVAGMLFGFGAARGLALLCHLTGALLRSLRGFFAMLVDSGVTVLVGSAVRLRSGVPGGA
jgi:hypothetical protein